MLVVQCHMHMVLICSWCNLICTWYYTTIVVGRAGIASGPVTAWTYQTACDAVESSDVLKQSCRQGHGEGVSVRAVALRTIEACQFLLSTVRNPENDSNIEQKRRQWSTLQRATRRFIQDMDAADLEEALSDAREEAMEAAAAHRREQRLYTLRRATRARRDQMDATDGEDASAHAQKEAMGPGSEEPRKRTRASLKANEPARPHTDAEHVSLSMIPGPGTPAPSHAASVRCVALCPIHLGPAYDN